MNHLSELITPDPAPASSAGASKTAGDLIEPVPLRRPFADPRAHIRNRYRPNEFYEYALHEPVQRLFLKYARSLSAALKTGVRLRHRKHGIELSVLNCVRFHVAADTGHVTDDYPLAPGLRPPWDELLPERRRRDSKAIKAMRTRRLIKARKCDDLSLLAPLSSGKWLFYTSYRHCVHLGMWNEIASMVRDIPPKRGAAHKVASWITKALFDYLYRHIDHHTLTSRVRELLPIDREFLRLVLRCHYGIGMTGLGSVLDKYNQALPLRHQIERVASLAPTMLPAVGELMREEQLRPESAPLARLKRRLKKFGGTPLNWRYLLNVSARSVWLLRRQNRLDGPMFDILRAWANLHFSGNGVDGTLPLPMLETILRTGPTDRQGRYTSHGFSRIARNLIQDGLTRAAQARAAGCFEHFIDDEWERVVWYQLFHVPVQRQRGPQPSWKTVIEAADRLLRGYEIASEMNPGRWPVPIAHFEHQGVTAIALRSAGEVAIEACTQRHCGLNYVVDLRKGEMLMYSLRSTDSDKRLATVAYSRDNDDQGWYLYEGKARANRPMSREAGAAARALAEVLTERQLQLDAAAREAAARAASQQRVRLTPELRARALLRRIAADSRGMAAPEVVPEDQRTLPAAEQALRRLLGRVRAESPRATPSHSADDRAKWLRNRHGQPPPPPGYPDEPST